ncbi:MAG TPA: ABC transporter ATP-binding protein [Pyrinomonadaceae bacterium]|nr:ABC transporter ATP-binding protein [Pyrinomonadaceae bacterium]
MGQKTRIGYLLKPHSWALTLAFLAVIGESVTDLLEPWPLKVVFDNVLGSKRLPDWLAPTVHAVAGRDRLSILAFAALSVVVIAVVGAISSYFEKYLTTSVAQWVSHDLRRTLYHHIQRLSLSYHDNKRTGDLISRITSDIDTVQDFISQVLLGFLVNVLTLVGMLAVMFYLNWRFTLIALSVAPVLFIVVYSFTWRIKQASRDVRKKEGEIASIASEVLSSIRVVQAFTREDYEQQRFERQSLETVESALNARSLKAKLTPIVEVIVAAGTCLVLWYGVRLVIAAEITPGALLVFLLYLGKMYKPMRDLSKMTDTISKTAVGYERIREVIDTDREVRNLPGARPAPNFKGKIEFDHVSFGYPDRQLTLEDVSLVLEPGQVGAIVGPTGAGKTTIVSLLARFYEPTKGEIKIDGVDIHRYKLKSLRRQISFVLQDSLLFRAPVWQNIGYGRPEASRREIIEAAKLANADEFIVDLPEGYDTMVGERGVTLSGGQRQRIAIARAIVRNSPILILDEPTSGLDAASEELVLEGLQRLMAGKTSIVIAHHLATVQRADVIFVLESGRIVQQGTHEELLQSGGLYAELYQTQFDPQITQIPQTVNDARNTRLNATAEPLVSQRTEGEITQLR